MMRKKIKQLVAGILCGVMLLTGTGTEHFVYAASAVKEDAVTEPAADGGMKADEPASSEDAGADAELEETIQEPGDDAGASDGADVPDDTGDSEEAASEEPADAGDAGAEDGAIDTDMVENTENTIILSDTWFTLDSEGTLTIFQDRPEGTAIPWASYTGNIKKAVVNDGVTRIEGYAFNNCRNLTSLTLPDGITSIGTHAFYNCNSLTSLTLPDGITSIGTYAFYNCSSLTSLELPAGITSIENCLFSGCSSLVSLELPAGITSIGYSAFYNCSSLTSLKLPAGITSIGTYTFSGCSSLTSLELPVGITSIERYAFSGCSSLTSLELPAGITSIGESTFSGCSSLVSLELPAGITSIGESAFQYCRSLTSLEFPAGITSIGTHAFRDCSSLTSLELPAGITSIGTYAFYNCSSLTNLELPAGITSIERYVFSGCSSLISLELPDRITSIGWGAFSACSSLISLELPAGITSIEENVFSGCSSLMSLELPVGVTSIERYAFRNCSSLTSLELPAGITSIGEGAFLGCSSLISLRLPAGITSIGESTFSDCNNLVSLELPAGITSIGKSAFYNCSNLASLELPDGIISIGESAFSVCSNLLSIKIPESVTSIEYYAFSNCKNLTIYGYPGSTAQIYAERYKINFISLLDTPFPSPSESGASRPGFSLSSSVTATVGGTIVVSGRLMLESEEEIPLQTLQDKAGEIKWTVSDASVANFMNCSVTKGTDGCSGVLSVSMRLLKEGITVLKGVAPNGYAAACVVTVKPGSGNTTIDMSNKDIRFKVYDMDSKSSLYRRPVSGAAVEIENISSSTTDEKGEATIPNTVEDEIAVKTRVSVKKEGYREYFFDRNIYNKKVGVLRGSNLITVALKKLQDKDATDPYVSTLICRSYGSSGLDVMQSQVRYDISKQTESVEMQMYAVWHDKTPYQYILYQKGGKTHISEDGNFRFDVTKDFIKDEPVYAKLVASDGTESEEETQIRIKETPIKFNTGKGATLVDTADTGVIGSDVAFLSGQNVSVKIKNVKIDVSVEQEKVRMTIGCSKKLSEGDYLEDKDWTEWKELCERPPQDMDFSQWNDKIAGVGTDWTASAKGETEVYGYAEGTLNRGGDTLVAGALKLKTSLDVGINAQYVVGVVPVYAKIAMGVDGSAEGKVTFNLTDMKFDKGGPQITLSLEPYLSAEGGIGYDGAFSVGVEGKGSMPFSCKIGSTNDDTKISVKGALSIKISAFMFSDSLTIVEKEWELLPGKSSRASIRSAAMSALSEDSFALSDDSYKNESAWSGSSPSADYVESILKTNIAPDAKVQAVNAGGTKMLLWTDSNPKRDSINSSTLFYSVYKEGSGWSAPAAVYDDQTADFSPSVVTNGEKIYVAWQNMSQKFDSNATLQTVSKAVTVCISAWEDGSFTTPVIASEKGKLAAMPKIALDGANNPYVVYVRNSQNTPFLNEGQNDILCTAVKDNSAGEPVVLVENAGLVMSLDTVYAGGCVVSYTLDEDGDRFTLEDRKVVTKGVSESTTQSGGLDSNAQYVQNGGNTYRIWYQDGALLMSGVSGDGGTVVCRDEDGTLTDDFRMVSGSAGQLAVLWAAAGEQGNKQITGILYDAASRSWSRPVRLLGTDADIQDPQGIFTDDGTLQFFYKKAGSGQTDLCTMTAPLSVDLSVERAYCDETAFEPGKTVAVSVKVKNNGSKKADSYTVSVAGESTEIKKSLAPGEEAIVEASYKVPDTISYGEVDVTVMAAGDIDETNNTYNLCIGYTDLAVRVEKNTYEFGQVIDISVGNESYVDTAASLEIRKNGRDGKILQSIDLETLSAGASKAVQYIWSEETDGYSEDISSLYFNAVAQEPEYFTNNNYDFAVVGDGVYTEEPPVETALTSLSAEKGKTEYTVGDLLNTDDLTVTASYSDGSKKEVSGFTTNADRIDMSSAGTKTLEITYKENGVTVKAFVSLLVKNQSFVIVPEMFTVIFDANGGTGLSESTRTVEEGKALGALPSVIRDGYTCKGWYTQREGGTQASQDMAVVSDMTLYARWEAQTAAPDDPKDPNDPGGSKDPSDKRTCKVTFDLRGKGVPLPEYADYTQTEAGTKMKKPAAPTAAGYQFTGWYKDAGCTLPWNFETDTVETDTVLYAGWDVDYDYDGILEGDDPSDGNTQGLWIAGKKSYTYTGAAIKPDVRVYYNEKRLKLGRDYTISYKNNKSAGGSGKKAPQIIVKGKGNYKGTLKETFEIKKASLDVSCLIASDSYPQGKSYTPVVMLGGNVLKAKTDYTLTYHKAEDGSLLKKSPTTAGSYIMRITGKGNCEENTFDFPFTVSEEGAASISKGKAYVDNMDYLGEYPDVSLSVDGEELTFGTDYTVRFSNTDTKGTATAVFLGMGNYTGTLKKTLKVRPVVLRTENISITDPAAYEKGGTQPEVTVTAGGVKLNEGVDYTVSYKGNTKVTESAKAVIKGKGNYSGSAPVSFAVVPKDLNTEGVQIFVSDAAPGKDPVVTVFDTNGKKLSSRSDYTADVHRDAHTVTITGGRNSLYTADPPIVCGYQELDKDKVITSAALNKKAEDFPKKFEYTENGVNLDKKWLTVKAGKYTLSSDEFEIIGYINHVQKGTATVVIQGTGEYGGTKILNFKIQSRSLPPAFRWVTSLLSGREGSQTRALICPQLNMV